jgi:hypothetical protein
VTILNTPEEFTQPLSITYIKETFCTYFILQKSSPLSNYTLYQNGAVSSGHNSFGNAHRNMFPTWTKQQVLKFC